MQWSLFLKNIFHKTTFLIGEILICPMWRHKLSTHKSSWPSEPIFFMAMHAAWVEKNCWDEFNGKALPPAANESRGWQIFASGLMLNLSGSWQLWMFVNELESSNNLLLNRTKGKFLTLHWRCVQPMLSYKIYILKINNNHLLNLKSYAPDKFIDTLSKRLKIKNDAEFARQMGIPSSMLSRMRHRIIPISATILLNIHEQTNIPIKKLRRMMGDKRPLFSWQIVIYVQTIVWFGIFLS